MKKTILALSFALLATTALAGTGSPEEQNAIRNTQPQTEYQRRAINFTLNKMAEPKQVQTTTHTFNPYVMGSNDYGMDENTTEPSILNTEISTYLPTKYIIVNIPAFKAYVVENNKIIFDTKVIIGKGTGPSTKTPEMVTNMTHVVWNPYWAPPFRYDREKTIRGWQGDPGYLRNNQLSVIKNSDHSFVPEHELTEEIFRSPAYTIVQTPGDGNMLGQALFMLDNEHNVYMHDTNSRHLFDSTRRNFSLGCIRVQEWLDIAAWALGRTTSQIMGEVNSGTMTFNQLPTNIPVFVVYWPADVVDGKVVFYDDIYNWVK